MTHDKDAPIVVPAELGFYVLTTSGEWCCRLCRHRHGGHDATCALVVLHVRVERLVSQLGLYVAEAREVLDDMDGLLRGVDLPMEPEP